MCFAGVHGHDVKKTINRRTFAARCDCSESKWSSKNGGKKKGDGGGKSEKNATHMEAMQYSCMEQLLAH